MTKLESQVMRSLSGRGLDELDSPPINRAERETAAKVERKNSASGLPWMIHSDHMPTQIIAGMDVDNHYTAVASTDSDDANPAGVDAANARLIVTAVNAHDALVNALQRCEVMSRALGGLTPREHEELGEIARAALAKVRP